MTTATKQRCDIKDSKLAPQGKKRILWADGDMPVLARIRERFAKEKPLAGLRMSACLHVTCETANLIRTLQAGGADVVLIASNPLSTQDDVAASLVQDFGLSVFAIREEDNDTYYKHIVAALAHEPHVTMDDGADLVSAMIFVALERLDDVHPQVRAWAQKLPPAERQRLIGQIVGSMEETTTGVNRLRDGARRRAALPGHCRQRRPDQALLRQPLRHRPEHHRRHHPGYQRALGRPQGSCVRLRLVRQGRCAAARGLGSQVIITEVDPVRALEAAMDGFQVLPLAEAAPIGDVFITVTGNAGIIRREHFLNMKDGALVCNSGHFDVEIDIPALRAECESVTSNVRANVDEYKLKKGKRIYLIGQGRLVNLAAAEGHPPSVMDMSFATQALATEYCVRNKGKLTPAVHTVPTEVEEFVARHKLESMGIKIDELTSQQRKYMSGWEQGT